MGTVMDTARFRSLVELIHKDIQQHEVAQRMDELVAAMKSWAGSTNAETASQFSTKLNELRTALGKTRTHELMPLQARMLREIDGAKFTGRELLDRVERVSREADTPADALPQLQAIRNEFHEFFSALGQLITSLDTLGIKAYVPEEGVHEISVMLPDELTRGELKVTNDLIHRWDRALGQVQELVTGRGDPVRVVALDRGSLVLIVGAAYPVAIATLKIVNMALDAYKRIHDIRLVQQQVKKLKLENAALQPLEDAEKAEAEKAVHEIAVKIVTECGSAELGGRTSEERETQVRKAVQFIMRQIDRGVEIEILLPPPPPALDGQGSKASKSAQQAWLHEIKSAPSKWRDLPKEASPILQLAEPDLDGEATESQGSGSEQSDAGATRE